MLNLVNKLKRDADLVLLNMAGYFPDPSLCSNT